MRSQVLQSCCYVVFFCLPQGLTAQSAHHIFLSVGALSNQTHDMLAAPVQYKGRGIPLSLSYQFENKDQQHVAAVHFSKTGFNGNTLARTRKNPSGGHANYLVVAWDYSYRKRIWRSAPVQLFAGPGWSNIVHIREYIYTPDNQEVSWDVLMSIGADLNAVYQIGRGTLDARLFLPVLSYINRPPYALEGDDLFLALFDRREYIKLGRLASVGQLIAASTAIGYTHTLSRRLRAGIGYKMMLYRYQEPRTTAAILQEVQLRLGLKF